MTRGVSPPGIGVSGGGSRLAQITAVAGLGFDFVDRRLTLGQIPSLLSGCRGKNRERKNPKIYHNLRAI